MASTRKIQSPGIELNEIDRSQYDLVDNSLPNSPNVFVTGFAAKGEDYALQWMNSKQTLDDTYGMPTTEFEKYFYNAINEVINRGGTCIAAKLPYDNNAKDYYNCIEYQFDLTISATNSNIHHMNEDGYWNTIEDFIADMSSTYLQVKKIEDPDATLDVDDELKTIEQIIDAVKTISEHLPQQYDLLSLSLSP